MSETIEIEVSNEEIAVEVALGIIGRAQDIHDNPHDDFEEVAEELAEVGQELGKEYDW